MQFDHVAEDRLDIVFAQWVKQLLSKSPEHLAMKLAASHVGRRAKQACQWKTGAFNVANEVVVLRYLRKYTSIPVPEVYGSGKTWTGPYIVLTYVHGTPLASILKDPKAEGRPILNSNISQRGLRRAYQEMAQLLLELSKPEFTRIGALVERPGGEFTVSRRPFTFNMNELSTSANAPPYVLPGPNAVFDSATDYFKSLATQHMLHFLTQR
ncbi:phosphotransferase enzyme family protein, partial [Trichophyton equinum CBS 127.97]